MEREKFMERAIELSLDSVNSGGGPFGALIVMDGQIVAEASNSVTLSNDPTAHAEVNAIRLACSKLGVFSLAGAELYTSCEPCPMCLAAAYWAGVSKIYYGNTREDAKGVNFDDSFIYDQIPLAPTQRTIPSQQMLPERAIEAFEAWHLKEDKIVY